MWKEVNHGIREHTASIFTQRNRQSLKALGSREWKQTKKNNIKANKCFVALLWRDYKDTEKMTRPVVWWQARSTLRFAMHLIGLNAVGGSDAKTILTNMHHHGLKFIVIACLLA